MYVLIRESNTETRILGEQDADDHSIDLREGHRIGRLSTSPSIKANASISSLLRPTPSTAMHRSLRLGRYDSVLIIAAADPETLELVGLEEDEHEIWSVSRET